MSYASNTRRSAVYALSFDVWPTISLFLSIDDLLSCRRTCKYLHAVLEERSVWHHVVQDLTSVIPLGHIQHTFASMSTEDLRKTSLTMLRADSNWPQGKIVHVVPFWYNSRNQTAVSQVSLLPGGEWLLMLLGDGTLNICQTLDLDAPPILTVKTSRALDDALYLDNSLCVMKPSTATPGGVVTRILVSEDYQDQDDDEPSTSLHVYDIDIQAQCIRHLETFTAYSGEIRFQSLQGDVLIYSWCSSDDGLVLVTIRTICSNVSSIKEEVVMKLDLPYACLYVVSLFPNDLLLLSSDLGLYMFNIPHRKPISTHSNYSAEMVAPFWSTTYPDYRICFPNLSPRIWNDTPNVQQDVCLSILTRKGLHTFSPSLDPDKCFVVTHPIPGELFDRCTARYQCQTPGSRRFVWVKRHHDPAMIMLSSCPYVTSGLEGHGGMLRLGQRTEEALPQWNIGIPIVGVPRVISWDEGTRRICLLVDGDYWRTAVLVIDL